MRRPVGVKSILFSFRETWFSPCRVATVAMLPSALSRSDSFRSVPVGRSRFSRCCHLISALWFGSFRVEPGPGHRRSHRNSALGFCLFSSWNGFDFVLPFGFTRLRLLSICSVVQRFVHFSAHPQMMQQHCQLSCRRHDRSLLALFPPRSASFSPQRLRSQSMPNGPKMCCAPCTNNVRR